MYSRRVTGELSKTRCSCEVLMCNEGAGEIEPQSSVFQLAELHEYIRDSFNLTEAICILFETISIYWDVIRVLKTRMELKLYIELILRPVIPSESLAWIQPHLTLHTVAREEQTLVQNAAVVLGKEIIGKHYT